jgi:hypothetical protein
MNKPAQALLENQIDFDLVPADVFARPEKFNASFDGLLHINGETYRAMVVPYAEFLTRATAVFAVKAQQAGFLVLFIQGLPSGISDEADHAVSGRLLDELKACRVVPLAELARRWSAPWLICPIPLARRPAPRLHRPVSLDPQKYFLVEFLV